MMKPWRIHFLTCLIWCNMTQSCLWEVRQKKKFTRNYVLKLFSEADGIGRFTIWLNYIEISFCVTSSGYYLLKTGAIVWEISSKAWFLKKHYFSSSVIEWNNLDSKIRNCVSIFKQYYVLFNISTFKTKLLDFIGPV